MFEGSDGMLGGSSSDAHHLFHRQVTPDGALACWTRVLIVLSDVEEIVFIELPTRQIARGQ